jgi:hypothetical protein
MDYNNPESWFPNVAPTGMTAGMGGAIIGAKMGIGLSQLGQQQKMQDMDMQRKQLELNNMQDEQGMKQAENAYRKKSFEDSLAELTSGLKRKVDEGEMLTKLEKQEAAKAEARLQKQLAMGSQAESLDQQIGEGGINPGNINYVRDAWKQAGFPDLPEDPMMARATIKQYADLHRNSGSRMDEDRKFLQQVKVHKLDNEARVTAAETRASIAENSAAYRELYRGDGSTGTANKFSTDQITAKALDKFRSDPDNMTTQDRAMVQAHLIKTMDPIMQKGLADKLSEIDNMDKPEKVKQELREKARSNFMGPMYDMVKGKGGSTAAPAKEPKADVKPTGRNLTFSEGGKLPADLQPGDIVNGHMFLGGPSTSADSWKK